MLCPSVLCYAECDNQQNAKSSVRAKTSAFLGKMLGQSSTRDRSVRSHLLHLDTAD